MRPVESATLQTNSAIGSGRLIQYRRTKYEV
jgi:hypothetical protein